MSPPSPDPLTQPTFRQRLRRRLRRDLRALGVLMTGYLCVAYLALPLWWRHRTARIDLGDAPLVTRTSEGIRGDAVNLALVGSRADVTHAMLAAGWYPADPITLRSSVRISTSSVLGRAYPKAPVSNLFLFGRRQDLAFERPDGASARKRHHVRFWCSDELSQDERPIWLGAATYDRSVGVSHRTGKVTHHIAPDIDAERDLIIADLTLSQQLVDAYPLPGIGPTLSGRNGGGDRYFTDGLIAAGVLLPEPDGQRPEPGPVVQKAEAPAKDGSVKR
jgi:hypothetical protein